MKTGRIWSFSGPYSAQMRENMDGLENSEYGHFFSRSAFEFVKKHAKSRLNLNPPTWQLQWFQCSFYRVDGSLFDSLSLFLNILKIFVSYGSTNALGLFFKICFRIFLALPPLVLQASHLCFSGSIKIFLTLAQPHKMVKHIGSDTTLVFKWIPDYCLYANISPGDEY